MMQANTGFYVLFMLNEAVVDGIKALGIMIWCRRRKGQSTWQTLEVWSVCSHQLGIVSTPIQFMLMLQ
jgi:hypothetical protein